MTAHRSSQHHFSQQRATQQHLSKHRLTQASGIVSALVTALALAACASSGVLDDAATGTRANVAAAQVSADGQPYNKLAMVPVPAPPAFDKPRLVKDAARISCVPYARKRTGIALRGNARVWWKKAKGRYAELAKPAAGAVMVFSGGKRLRSGHLAVVTRIVSPREIRVDHANWPGGGKVYLNVPVYDVSARNDWSKVRVYDVPSGQPGIHVYPVSGFIAKPVRTASNDAG
ncbi:MAG TPA: CHAP domain-containing protein [Rhizomicrobium sp.]|nr:CHAP domain-containing protein [Rhizomicrobium sp.]